jgi:hypothetical protein
MHDLVVDDVAHESTSEKLEKEFTGEYKKDLSTRDATS